MDTKRRKMVDGVIYKIKDIQNEIEHIYDMEKESAECIPENMQRTDRYWNDVENCESLSSAADSLNNTIKYLKNSKK